MSDRDFIKIHELYAAYRKAKYDVYWENFQPKRLEFAKYEERLPASLDALHSILQTSPWDEHEIFKGGRFVPVPKPPKMEGGTMNHMITNDARLVWESMRRDDIGIEFKKVADLPVSLHIVSALWINKIGEKFDRALSRSVYGSRLKRIGPWGGYNMAALGSFVHYPTAYRAWRKNGINAMKNAIERNRDLVALTLDFSDFFGSIDPCFMINEEFHAIAGVPLSEQEIEFTKRFIQVMQACTCSGTLGIPIGLAASSVIANALLLPFDRQIEQNLFPAYYGRYMDDVFLVLDNEGRAMTTPRDVVMKVMQLFNTASDAQILGQNGAAVKIGIPEHIYGATNLKFQSTKQRCFILKANSAADLLDLIEKQIDALSSERRLLPTFPTSKSDIVNETIAAIAADARESVDSLRKTDHVSIKRLGVANLLRTFSVGAKLFTPSEWREPREWFAQFIESNIMAPHQLLNVLQYLPRILEIFVQASDWDAANRFVALVKKSILNDLAPALPADKSELVKEFWSFLQRWFVESMWASLPATANGMNTVVAPATGRSMARFLQRLKLTAPENWLDTVASLHKSDLARVPASEFYWNRELVFGPGSEDERRMLEYLGECYGDKYLQGARILMDNNDAGKPWAPRAFLFPTRKISQIWLCKVRGNAARDVYAWRYLNKFSRGISWISHETEPPVTPPEEPGSEMVVIGREASVEDVVVAVTSVQTTMRDFSRAAAGQPNDGVERYNNWVPLINSIIQSRPRPGYVLFPELSVPQKFADFFGVCLLSRGVSSIMGVEYGKTDNPEVVVNDAHLYMTDDRLGFPSFFFYRSRKAREAPHEREFLRAQYNKRFAGDSKQLPVVVHRGLRFSVLICSELTNVDYRSALRGEIDMLFVPAFNQDLNTFASLVESTALDLSCFVVFSNNRMYGDSRVRGPFKEPWERDMVRLRGGTQDYAAACIVPIRKLRAFQTFHIAPDKGFKPTPEGYEANPARKVPPWKVERE